MEFKPSMALPTRAESRHRRQRFWQIWLPLILAVLVVLGVAVWTVVSAVTPGPSLTKWSDISAVWLILPLCLAGILFLVLAGAFIYLNARIYRGLPGLDRKVQAVFYRIENGVKRAADQSVKPIFTVNGWSASWNTLLDRLFHR